MFYKILFVIFYISGHDFFILPKMIFNSMLKIKFVVIVKSLK